MGLTGNIFEIKHFAVHDGPGIRTTVFFKGCPLSCLWCHNPESKDVKKQIAVFNNKCTLCGKCASVCENGVHSVTNVHTLDRSKCVFCGKCEKACFNSAIKIYGIRVTAEDIIDELTEDKDFFASDGGVTLSGGECLAQADFAADLLRKLKMQNIRTAVDTCGFVPQSAFEKVMDYTDLFLYDIKSYFEETHIKCTGQSNKIIWDNLDFLSENGKSVIIRIPYIPEYNSGEIGRIAERLGKYKNIQSVDVLPYHNFSGSKYEALGEKNTMPNVPMPEKNEIENAKNILRSVGLKVND